VAQRRTGAGKVSRGRSGGATRARGGDGMGWDADGRSKRIRVRSYDVMGDHEAAGAPHPRQGRRGQQRGNI
jgi:hypothetical protein